jgi:hypothetical protein
MDARSDTATEMTTVTTRPGPRIRIGSGQGRGGRPIVKRHVVTGSCYRRSVMPARSKKPRTLDEVLSRLGAKLEAWQVRALFLGAQTSTNMRLGPQHLLSRIFGDDLVLGDDLDDMNANLQVLMGVWNQLVADQQADHVTLSTLPTSDPPTRAELEALAKRRNDEITWFLRGLDAGGDDPVEFGPEGERLFRKLAEGSAFLEGIIDLLGRMPDEDVPKARQAIDRLTAATETIISDLMTVSDGIRRLAIAEYERMAGRRTDDGVAVARPVKVGRNEPCPCGSGKKWKHCCGAPSRVQ